MKQLFGLSFLLAIITSCGQTNKSENTGDMDNTPATENQDTAPTTLTTYTDTMQEQNIEYKVKLSTSYGDMVIKLYNETPKHRDNFIKLAKEGYYNDMLFHRVIKDFMIQGGDPDSKNAKPGQMLGQGGPGYTVPAEFRTGLYHKKGALAAARQADQVNPTKASSGSQFYVVQGKKYTDGELAQIEKSYGMVFTEEQKKTYREVGGTPFLDNNYTVFGEVIEGMDVIEKIAAVKTSPQSNRPVDDVKMKITIVE